MAWTATWKAGGEMVRKAGAVIAGIVLAGVAAGAVEGGGQAQSPEQAAGEDQDRPRARAELIAEQSGVTPGGTITLGVHFRIDPEWHIYWNGLNDTGFGPQMTWTVPEGYEVGPAQWPAPKRYISPGDILDHIYEDSVTILVPLKAPSTAKAGDQISISCALTWMVCKDVCRIERGEVSMQVPVVHGLTRESAAPAAQGAPDARFARTRARLPEAVQPGTRGLAVQWRGDTVEIRVDGAKELSFYPQNKGYGPLNALKQGHAKADRMILECGVLAGGGGGEEPASTEARLEGVLEVVDAQGARRVWKLDVRRP